MNAPSSSIPDSANSNKWFACPQAHSGAETRLFFFPYAGGGPAVFGKWYGELPNHLEGWVAHYPGRGSRNNEPPIKRLITLVENLAQAMQPLLDKPFAFFGHSLGGLVSFELARHLRQNNLPQPTMLFISACGAPQILDPHPPIHTLPDSEFLKALERLDGIPPEFLQDPDILKLFLPALRADFELIESYHYDSTEPPLDCPINAFGGLDDPRVSRDRLEGWASQTTSRFESQYFSGDHFFTNTSREAIIESITEEIIPSPTGKHRLV